MNWRAKALMMRFFSHVPGGDAMHYWTQRYLTHSLPSSRTQVQEKVDLAERYVQAIQANMELDLRDAAFVEIGAGRELAVPLALYRMGVNHQVLQDVEKLARMELVNEVASHLRAMGQHPLCLDARRCLGYGGAGEYFQAFLRSSYGIFYRAPMPLGRLHKLAPPASVHAITSTDTFEHMTVEDIQATLQGCMELLVPGGCVAMRVDFDDHYSKIQTGLPTWNFLRFTEGEWAFFNPPLHYQNRLRYPDYIDMFHDAGFDIPVDQPTLPFETEVHHSAPYLDKGLVGEWRSYSHTDILTHNAFFVLRKSR